MSCIGKDEWKLNSAIMGTQVGSKELMYMMNTGIIAKIPE